MMHGQKSIKLHNTGVCSFSELDTGHPVTPSQGHAKKNTLCYDYINMLSHSVAPVTQVTVSCGMVVGVFFFVS
jgi:hypothetical protein